MSASEVGTMLVETPREARRRLVGELRESLGSTGGLVVVRGLPGAGASSFLHEWALQTEEVTGASPIRASADLLEEHIAYSFIDRLRAASPSLDQVLGEADESVTSYARGLISSLTASPTTMVEPARPGQPVTLVLDDLQWCDGDSAQVLRFALPRLLGRGVVVVASIEVGHFSALERLCMDLAEHDSQGRHVTLEPLTVREVQLMVEEQLGIGLSARVADQLRLASGGNLRALGAILQAVSAAEINELYVTRLLPVRVAREAAERALAAYRSASPAAQLVVQVCALVGHPVPGNLLPRVARRLGESVDVPGARASELVFEHPLTAEIGLTAPFLGRQLLGEVHPVRRKSLHQILASCTQGIDALRHRIASTDPLPVEAVDEVVAAARELESNGQIWRAIDLLDEVAADCHGGPHRRRLLQELALTHIRNVSAETLHERLDEFDTGAGSPLEGYISCWIRTQQAHGAIDARSLRDDYLAQPSQDATHAMLQADIAQLSFISSLQHDDPARTGQDWMVAHQLWLQCCELDDADTPHWLHPPARLLFLEAFTLLDSPRDVDTVSVIAQRARRLDSSLPEKAEVLSLAALTSLLNSRLDPALEYSAEAIDLLPRLLRPPLAPGQIRLIRAVVLARAGRWDEAEAVLNEAVLAAYDGQDMPTRSEAPALAALINAARGRWDEARRLIISARRADRYQYRGIGFDALALAEFEIARHCCDPREALALAREAARNPRYTGSARVPMILMDALLRVGEPEEAARVWEQLQVDSPWGQLPHACGTRGRILVLQGQREAGLATMREAVASCDSPYWRAILELNLAELLALEGCDEPEALELLQDCIDAFDRLDALPYLRESRALAADIVEHREHRLRQLTARERQIAHLAAEGWTNKEIATKLRISVSTVGFHLGRVFERLHVHRRCQLAEALRVVPPRR